MIKNLALALPNCGWKVVVLTENKQRDLAEARQEFAKHDIPIVELDTHLLPEEKASQIVRAVHDLNCQMVVANYAMATQDAFDMIPSNIGRCMVIHSDESYYYLWAKRYSSCVEMIITVSQYCAEQVNYLLGPNSVVRYIPNGITLSDLEPRKDSSAIRLLYAGRLVTQQKRVLDLLTIAEELRQRGTPFLLSIAGSGPQEAEMKSEVKARGLSETVRFLGRIPREDVYKLMQTHEIFLLTSEYEGMPVALLEAMSYGMVPVVTRIKSGVPELVDDGSNGCLLDVGDTHGFVERIAYLNDYRAALHELSRAAYGKIESNFTVDHMAKRYAEAFEICCERAPTSQRSGKFSYPGRYPDYWHTVPLPIRKRVYTIESALRKVKQDVGRKVKSYVKNRYQIRASKKPAVARILSTYLAINGAFLYYFHTNIQNFQVKILCRRYHNLDVYPLDGLLPPVGSGGWRSYAYRRLNQILPSAIPYVFYSKLVVREGIRIIHAEHGGLACLAYQISQAFDLPLIVSFIGADASSDLRTERYVSLSQLQSVFRRAFAVIVLSKVMKERLVSVGCPRGKIAEVHLGVDMNMFPFREREIEPHGKVRFLFVGRLAEKKGIDIAVRAFSKLLKSYSMAELHVIGDGPMRSVVEKLVTELQLNSVVKLYGTQPPQFVRQMMQNCDLFVLPSQTAQDGDQEGTPTVLIEAQAAGMPVLSTYHAGIPEQVIHGKTGLLTEEKNIDGLTENMLWMVDNPQKWSIMGRTGRQHISKNYNIKREVRKLEDIYRAALQ